MILRLLTQHHLEFLTLKGGCTDSSESTLLDITCHSLYFHTVARIQVGSQLANGIQCGQISLFEINSASQTNPFGLLPTQSNLGKCSVSKPSLICIVVNIFQKFGFLVRNWDRFYICRKVKCWPLTLYLTIFMDKFAFNTE